MAEIANSSSVQVAAMAIAYEVTIKSFCNDNTTPPGEKYIKAFLERYHMVYAAVSKELEAGG